MRAQAKILLHPCFGQPKVENPVIRGKKKGCLSFQMAQRRREVSRPKSVAEVVLAPKVPYDGCSKLVAGWIEEARAYLLYVEAAMRIEQMESGVAK